jgi:nitric oxide reductase NorQ protein
MKHEDVADAVRAGATTTREIAEHVGLDRSHVGRELKRMVENGVLERHPRPSGNGYFYSIAPEDTDASDTDMPVLGNRDYDWNRFVPRPSAAEYIPSGNELTEIEAIIDARSDTGQLPRFRLGGPPGTGKTTLAEHIAAERQWPVIEVQLTASMREPDLFGSPQLIGGETVWADGPITRALLCSQERPTVLVLDEVNRASSRSKTALMPVLDHRARAVIKARGNEVIEGNAENLIVVSTMNEGPEFDTNPLDPAERRRLGNMWYISFLGLEHPEKEIDLVVQEASVSQTIAEGLVHAANAVREAALDNMNERIRSGIPTSDVIRWAQTAASYHKAGLNEPVLRAAESAITDPRYDSPTDETVRATLAEALSDSEHQASETPDDIEVPT